MLAETRAVATQRHRLFLGGFRPAHLSVKGVSRPRLRHCRPRSAPGRPAQSDGRDERHRARAVVFSVTRVSRFLGLCWPYVLRYWLAFLEYEPGLGLDAMSLRGWKVGEDRVCKVLLIIALVHRESAVASARSSVTSGRRWRGTFQDGYCGKRKERTARVSVPNRHMALPLVFHSP